MSGKTLVVKLKKGGQQFEVLTKIGSMEQYRAGKMKMDQVLITDDIFKNASKFDKIKNTELKKAFGSENKIECIQIILNEGTYPLSKKEMIAKVAFKRKEIINYLHKFYFDPAPLKDGHPARPHPISRFDTVLNEMKINIDPHSSLHSQIRDIVKLLPEFLPVKPINPPHMNIGSTSNGSRRRGKNK
jgi:ribosome maturation protein Sdo1